MQVEAVNYHACSLSAPTPTPNAHYFAGSWGDAGATSPIFPSTDDVMSNNSSSPTPTAKCCALCVADNLSLTTAPSMLHRRLHCFAVSLR